MSYAIYDHMITWYWKSINKFLFVQTHWLVREDSFAYDLDM